VLGDGSDAFQPAILAADLREVADGYDRLHDHVGSPAWHAPSKASDWTMAATIAHLDVMTATGLAALDDTLHGRQAVFDGIAARRGLTAWDETTIRQRLTAEKDVLGSLVDGLRRSADRIEQLDSHQLTLPVTLPIYNAPMTVAEFWGIQTFHPGLTHSAQATDTIHAPPLWRHLDDATRHRMITRLTRALGYLYWPERGGPGGVSIRIDIAGPGGGSWHVIGDPSGADGGTGPPDDPDLTLRFDHLDTVCRMFTGRLPMLGALLRRRLRVSGNLRILRRFGDLFSADG
jgi:hypothetical protein